MAAYEKGPRSSPFPPNVVLYLRAEIDRRTEYKVRLENTNIYAGYDDFSRRQNTQKRNSLQYSIDALTDGIIKIVKRHMPSIEVVEGEPEVTISNILAVLPTPEEVIIKKIFHGSH